MKKNEKKNQFGYYLVCLFVFVFVLCFVFDTIIKNVVINFLMIFFSTHTYLKRATSPLNDLYRFVQEINCSQNEPVRSQILRYRSKVNHSFTNEPCRAKGVPENSCKTLTKTTKNLLYRTKSVQHAYTVY